MANTPDTEVRLFFSRLVDGGAQVDVPPQPDDVHEEHPQVRGDEGEVDQVRHRPDPPAPEHGAPDLGLQDRTGLLAGVEAARAHRQRRREREKEYDPARRRRLAVLVWTRPGRGVGVLCFTTDMHKLNESLY